MKYEEKKLSELVDTISDTRKIDKDKVVLVNTSDVLAGEVLNHTYTENCNLRGQFKKRFKTDDILYSEIRPANKRFAYIDFDSEDYIASTKLMVLRRKSDKITNKYLYYCLTNDLFVDRMQHLAEARSGTFPQITFDVLKGETIYLPSIANQNKITSILDNINNKIRLNNEINNNLFDLGRTYFEDFISNCDEEVAIKDIADEVLDYTKNNNDKVKLLNSSDITENIFPNVEFIDNKNLKGHFKKRFKKYDILYSQIRPRNHHYGYVLLDDSENYLASTRFMVVRNKKEKVSSSLLYYYLTSKNAVEDFTTKTELRSGTFPQGNYEDLSSYVIRYSSNQELITKILDSILETINNNNNENEKLVELRDILLPKLMNGEIDLDKIEI